MYDMSKDLEEFLNECVVLPRKEQNELKRLIKDKLVVLAGQTGAGKSSLLNRLDDDLDLKTQEMELFH